MDHSVGTLRVPQLLGPRILLVSGISVNLRSLVPEIQDLRLLGCIQDQCRNLKAPRFMEEKRVDYAFDCRATLNGGYWIWKTREFFGEVWEQVSRRVRSGVGGLKFIVHGNEVRAD